MPTDVMDGVGVWTPRQNLLNGYLFAVEKMAVRGELTRRNAEANSNIEELDRLFPKQADMLDLCRRVGAVPLATMPPLHGPGYPRTHPRLLHWRTSAYAQPRRGWVEPNDDCSHLWIVLQQGGYDCNDCLRHFGAWD